MINIKRKDFVRTKKSSNFISKKLDEISTSFDFLTKVNFEIDFKTFKIILISSSILGFLIGILLRNPVLSLILAITIPFLEIEILYFLEKEMRIFVEDIVIKSGNVIKNTYLYSKDVKTAITDNIKRFESPLRELFEGFKTEVNVYHYSVEESLKKLPLKIKSKSLEEITEQLILCNKDRANAPSFIATISQLNDKLIFLQSWSNMKKSMLGMFSLVLSGVILMPIVIIKGLDETNAFLRSSNSGTKIALYILCLLIITILTLRDINEDF